MKLNNESLEYVSVETAKQLKEKRFRYPVNMFYTFNKCDNEFLGEFRESATVLNYNKFKDALSCPTQALAQQWLREVHNIHIAIYNNASGYGYGISKADTGTHILNDLSNSPNDGGMWNSYEESLGEAIKECLKLIK